MNHCPTHKQVVVCYANQLSNGFESFAIHPEAKKSSLYAILNSTKRVGFSTRNPVHVYLNLVSRLITSINGQDYLDKQFLGAESASVDQLPRFLA
jgi:hypothetical protein